MNTNGMCKTCKYWTGNRTAPQQGQCRRYPPAPAGLIPAQSLVSSRPEIRTVFVLPDTTADHWCGEFSPEMLNG